MPETQADEREQQRQAEMEDLKRPRVSEETRRLLSLAAENGAGFVPVLVADLRALLDEIDRLEQRWQRMATGGPLGTLRRSNKTLGERVTLLGLQIRQQGQVIERLKATNTHLAARAEADEALLARQELRVDLEARVADAAVRQLEAVAGKLEEERQCHEVTRRRLAEARGEAHHGPLP